MINVPFSFIQFSDCENVATCKEIEKFYLQFANGDVIIAQISGNIVTDFIIDLETKEGVLIQENIATFANIAYNKQITINLPSMLSLGCYRLKLKGYQSQFCILPISGICALPILDICGLSNYQIELGCFEFQIINDTCYTAIVKYSNQENSAGFDYSNGFFNQLRLPIKYGFPQNQTKTENYRTSNGQIIRLSSKKTKEYELETDYANEHFHDCISTMLDSDNLQINELFFVGNGNYEVEWNTEIGHTNLAKGKGKITLTPYNNQNPNFI